MEFMESNVDSYANEMAYLMSERNIEEERIFQEVFSSQNTPVKIKKKFPRFAKSSYLYKRKLPQILWKRNS